MTRRRSKKVQLTAQTRGRLTRSSSKKVEAVEIETKAEESDVSVELNDRVDALPQYDAEGDVAVAIAQMLERTSSSPEIEQGEMFEDREDAVNEPAADVAAKLEEVETVSVNEEMHDDKEEMDANAKCTANLVVPKIEEITDISTSELTPEEELHLEISRGHSDKSLTLTHLQHSNGCFSDTVKAEATPTEPQQFVHSEDMQLHGNNIKTVKQEFDDEPVDMDVQSSDDEDEEMKKKEEEVVQRRLQLANELLRLKSEISQHLGRNSNSKVGEVSLPSAPIMPPLSLSTQPDVESIPTTNETSAASTSDERESSTSSTSTTEKNDEPSLKEDLPPSPKVPPYVMIEKCIYMKKGMKEKKTKSMFCLCREGSNCGIDCLNRTTYTECPKQCCAGKRCTNRRFTKKQYAKVEPFFTGELKGFGLRAVETIEAGDFIIEYVGEIVDWKEFVRRCALYDKRGKTHHYSFNMHPDVIDATEKGNPSRFINHSCDPNAICENWSVPRTEGNIGRIGFFAKKKISAGDEITFDYNFQNFGKAQKCFCGADNCRGTIGAEGEAVDEEERDDDTVEDDTEIELDRQCIEKYTVDEINARMKKLASGRFDSSKHVNTLVKLMKYMTIEKLRLDALNFIDSQSQTMHHLCCRQGFLPLLARWLQVPSLNQNLQKSVLRTILKFVSVHRIGTLGSCQELVAATGKLSTAMPSDDDVVNSIMAKMVDSICAKSQYDTNDSHEETRLCAKRVHDMLLTSSFRIPKKKKEEKIPEAKVSVAPPPPTCAKPLLKPVLSNPVSMTPPMPIVKEERDTPRWKDRFGNTSEDYKTGKAQPESTPIPMKRKCSEICDPWNTPVVPDVVTPFFASIPPGISVLTPGVVNMWAEPTPKRASRFDQEPVTPNKIADLPPPSVVLPSLGNTQNVDCLGTPMSMSVDDAMSIASRSPEPAPPLPLTGQVFQECSTHARLDDTDFISHFTAYYSHFSPKQLNVISACLKKHSRLVKTIIAMKEELKDQKAMNEELVDENAMEEEQVDQKPLNNALVDRITIKEELAEQKTAENPPSPPPPRYLWKKAVDNEGSVYFYNLETREAVWELPDGAETDPNDATPRPSSLESGHANEGNQQSSTNVEDRVQVLFPSSSFTDNIKKEGPKNSEDPLERDFKMALETLVKDTSARLLDGVNSSRLNAVVKMISKELMKRERAKGKTHGAFTESSAKRARDYTSQYLKRKLNSNTLWQAIEKSRNQ